MLNPGAVPPILRIRLEQFDVPLLALTVEPMLLAVSTWIKYELEVRSEQIVS